MQMIAHGPADATVIPSSLASLKSRMAYISGAGLPRLSWKKAVGWVHTHHPFNALLEYVRDHPGEQVPER